MNFEQYQVGVSTKQITVILNRQQWAWLPEEA